MSVLSPIVAPFLAVFAIAYAALAVHVSRSGPQNANSMVSFFLFLIGGMLAGSAFSYGATDANFYGIGRTLSFFSSGFIPVVFYLIYREYTVGRPNTVIILMLCIIPLVTTGMALTNSLKHGGDATVAFISVHYGPEEVSITITDTGRGAVSSLSSTGGGNGLLGMRERVDAYQGDFTAGPKPGGGYEVRARLPMRTLTAERYRV